jgi:hypothetical protein
MPFKESAVRLLWTNLLAGPIIWVVYFILGYSVVEAACYLNILQNTLLGFKAISIVIVGLTLLASLITLGMGFLAYRHWQQLRGYEEAESSPEQTGDYRHFMLRGGMVLSGLFAFIIFITALPVFWLSPCYPLNF